MAIFSGESSNEFWDEVKKSNSQIIYDYGCKAQELEAQIARLEAERDKLAGFLYSIRSTLADWRGGAD